MHCISIDLRRHCVLTGIKRRYERFLAKALRGGDLESACENKLEFLKAVLEQVDLVRLRDEIPELNAGSAAAVRLEQAGQDELRLMLDGREVFRQALHLGRPEG